MEVWMVEGAALFVLLISIVQGACQGFVLKIYSLIRVILLVAGTVVAVPIVLALIPKNVEWRAAGAWIITLVIVGVVLGVIGRALKIVDHIPVVKHLNKMGGALAGAAIGIILLWLLLLVFELSAETPLSEEINRCVSESVPLEWLAQVNPLTNIQNKIM